MGKKSRQKKLGRALRPAAQKLVEQLRSMGPPATTPSSAETPEPKAEAQQEEKSFVPGASIPVVYDQADLSQMLKLARRERSLLWRPAPGIVQA